MFILLTLPRLGLYGGSSMSMGHLNHGSEGDGPRTPHRLHWLQPGSLFQLFITINVITLYGYLFWDSISFNQSALVGGSEDVLYLKNDRFMDWVNTLRSARLSLPYGMQGQVAMPVYPPLTYALLRPLAALLLGSTGDTGVAKVVWVGVTCVVLVAVCRNVTRLRLALHSSPSGIDTLQLLVVVLVSYPFLFAFDRGNLDLVTFALVSWFVVLQFSPPEHRLCQKGSYNLLRSSLVLAIAASIKPYTFLFVLLAAAVPASSPRRQRLGRILCLSLTSLAFVLILSLLSLLWLYHGDLAQGFADYRYWQQQFMANYIVGGTGDKFFSSPYVAIKIGLLRLGASASVILDYVRIYPILAFAVCVAVLVKACRLRRPDPGVMLTTICFCILVFPYNANEYKSIYFLLPFLLFRHHADFLYRSPSATEVSLKRASQSFIGSFSRRSWSPIAVSVALCFGLLLNRYGLTGNGLLASLIASLLLMAFPLLFLTSQEPEVLHVENQ